MSEPADGPLRPADSLSVVLDEKTVAGLAGLGVSTVGELLRHTPRRYVKQGQLSEDSVPEAGEWVTVVGRITGASMIPMRKRRGSFLKVTVTDGNRSYGASFFNARFIKTKMVPGARVMLAGKVSFFRDEIQLSHPEWAIIPDGPELVDAVGSAMMHEAWLAGDPDGDGPPDPRILDRPIMPVYPSSKEIQTWTIARAVSTVLTRLPTIGDALSGRQRAERQLVSADEALRQIHLPDSETAIEQARRRLKFDEALAVQTALAQRRLTIGAEAAPPCGPVPGGLEEQLLGRLPFELTDGQLEVLDEIGDDLSRPHPMNRLLQGEVGSGKTLVSLLAMLRVVDNGFQCVILAPTEVLAAQHYRTVTTMLGDLATAGELGAAEGATAVALLTGSMSTPAKRQTLLDIVSGTAGIVIGTHALLEDNVTFADLGMVVVDEQHRFGVEQRDVLRSKGRELRPHFLVMTATPIPRTVAMTSFGDLDTSVLSELPRGRQPITTTVVPMRRSNWVERVWDRAAEEILAGRQVYVVCTRIGDEKSAADASEISVLDQWQELAAGPLAEFTVEYLHGRMPAEEKNAVMDGFTRGDVDVIVSTTVIEVGVDVPNATMMVIVNAERFGVSQLHQLRGRVGRGEYPGLCLLMTTASEVSASMQRLRAVEASTDGFELSLVDLQARKEGDVLGSLQSGGKSSLRFLSLIDDTEVIADARELADEIVAGDLALADHRELADLVDAVLVPTKLGYLDKT